MRARLLLVLAAAALAAGCGGSDQPASPAASAGEERARALAYADAVDATLQAETLTRSRQVTAGLWIFTFTDTEDGTTRCFLIDLKHFRGVADDIEGIVPTEC